jgi:hypothetical protein
VDVPADHTVHAALPAFSRNRALEVGDVADGVLHPVLEMLGERPIGKAKARANRVQPSVQMQDEVVQLVAEKREPPRALDDPVENVAVQYEQAAAIRGYMHDLFPDLHSSERKLQEVSPEFVVVAWDEYDAGPLARLAQIFCTTSLCTCGQYQRRRSCQPSMISPTT